MIRRNSTGEKIDFKCLLFLLFSCWILGFQNLIGAPIVTSVSPTNGGVAGGNVVTVRGSGFSGASDVRFGIRLAPGFTVLNDSTISVTVPAGTPGTVDVTVTAVDQSPTSRNDFYTYTAIGWKGIISSMAVDQVVLFNTATDAFDALIPLSNTSLASVITPDGMSIYTANEMLPGFSVIDAATNTVTTTVSTAVGDGAFDIVVNPLGTRVYISNNTSGFVTVVDTVTNTVITDIFVQPNIGPLSITPDGSTVFVGCFSSGEVIPINTATDTPQASIPTGFFPGKISITPDGKKAFIPVFFTDTVLVIDVAARTITNSIPLPAGSGPYGSSLLPDGTKLYVVNIGQNSISVVDVATETLTATLSLPLLAIDSTPYRGLPPPNSPGSSPFWAAATPDSKTVYVISETNNSVIPIDTRTNTIGTPFDGITGSFEDLVISPDPAPVAAFAVSAQPTGAAMTFDASMAISPIGTIVSYAWDFGDGTIVTTTSPVIEHIYAVPGNYTVNLTVTNSAGTSTKKVFSSGFMSNNGGPTAFLSRIVQSLRAPPINLRGRQVKNQFLTQTEYVNVLKWKAPLFGEKPAFYEVFRGSPTHRIGTVSGKGPFTFKDHNRKKNVTYTYYVVAVSGSGARSAPAVVAVTTDHSGSGRSGRSSSST